MDAIARTPSPPYYAVVFTSRRTEDDEDGYGVMAERMVQLAKEQPGFLGVESVRGADGVGITVSYWESEEAIKNWHQQIEHQEAQRLGRSRWYDEFQLRICRVERAYGFERGKKPGFSEKPGFSPAG